MWYSLLWFIDYLANRYQQVRCNKATVSFQAITCGLLQDLILAHCYLCYISNVCKFLKLILFADDTNAFYSHKSKVELTRIVNDKLQLMKNWFGANRLSLNLENTKLYCFSHPPKD